MTIYIEVYEMADSNASETRQTIFRDLLLPTMVSLIVAIATGALGIYVTQQRFGDRLDRAEADIQHNKAELTAGLEKLTDRVAGMSVDVSWIRGRLENRITP
jgi:hypothetical protein